MCTLPKRTNTVQILYKYCTYDGEGILKLYGLAVYEVCCSVVCHSVSPCAAAAYGVPFSGLWGCKRRLRGPILQDFSLRRLSFCYSLFLTGITSNRPGINWKFFFKFKQQLPSRWYAGASPAILTGITSNRPGINRNFLKFKQQLPSRWYAGASPAIFNSNYQQLVSNYQQFARFASVII